MVNAAVLVILAAAMRTAAPWLREME